MSGTIITEHQFSGNKMYDPNDTGTGGQPMGYDQWANFYGRYLVYGSKITLKWVNNTDDNVWVGVIPLKTAADMNDYADNFSSAPYAKWTVLGPPVSNRGLANMSSYMSTKKFQGITQLDEFDFGGDMAADVGPNREWFWGLRAYTLDGAGNASVQCFVSITYYAKLYRRSPMSQS